jgi:hypothetical protein
MLAQTVQQRNYQLEAIDKAFQLARTAKEIGNMAKKTVLVSMTHLVIKDQHGINLTQARALYRKAFRDTRKRH